MQTKPMSAGELAGRLGHNRDWLYRRVLELMQRDKMPAPLTSRGRYAWDRPSIEAWLSRHHPAAGGMKAANDAAPQPPPADDAAWRSRLAGTYGGRRNA